MHKEYAQPMSALPQPSQLKAWKEALLLDYPSLTPSMADFALYLHVEACRKAAHSEIKTDHDSITADPHHEPAISAESQEHTCD